MLLKITNENLDKVYKEVLADEAYGKEDKLITDAFSKYPKNNDIAIIALKIGLIDITNSTNISRYKSKISVVELAEHIAGIKDIDKRIADGDPTVVEEIAGANGNINLFSFASKYCCYHNRNVYGRDDYSIFDTVLMETLPMYFDDIKKSKIESWRADRKYKLYNDFITKKLDELNITTSYRRRKFDYFVWYPNK